MARSILKEYGAALKSVPPGNIKNVNFRVERGVTTLTGTVAGVESRHRVNDAVASVLGVLDVRNNLDVAGGKDDSSS